MRDLRDTVVADCGHINASAITILWSKLRLEMRRIYTVRYHTILLF